MKKKITIIILFIFICNLIAGCTSINYPNFHGFRCVDKVDLGYINSQAYNSKKYKYDLNVIVLPFDDERKIEDIETVYNEPFSIIVAKMIVESAGKQGFYKSIRLAKKENYLNRTIMMDTKDLMSLLRNEKSDMVIYGTVNKLKHNSLGKTDKGSRDKIHIKTSTEIEINASVFSVKDNAVKTLWSIKKTVEGEYDVISSNYSKEKWVIEEIIDFRNTIQEQIRKSMQALLVKSNSESKESKTTKNSYEYPKKFKIVHNDDTALIAYFNPLSVLVLGTGFAVGIYGGMLSYSALTSGMGTFDFVFLNPLGWTLFMACVFAGGMLGICATHFTISDDAIYQKGIDRGLYAGEFKQINDQYLVFKTELLSQKF